MSNKGRFTDRSPIICPAGKIWDANGSVSECLQEYSTVDHIDAIKHETKTKEKTCFPYVPRKTVNSRNPGIFCESYNLFITPITRRYETLIGDLRETTYQSLWDKTLGKVRDPTGYLPLGMDVETTTFGLPSKKEDGVKELVNPSKSHLEVLLESQEGHELYRKSHNDYNLNEHINRGYLRPAFDPNKRYGMRTRYDPKGTWAKCALTWHLQEQIGVARDIKADVAEKKKSKLGKCLTPNNNIEKAPKGFRFGKRCERQLWGVWELLRDQDIEPCTFRRDLMKWLEHINQLRTHIHKQRGIINLTELYNRFKYFDKEQTGWLPVDVLYEICHCQRINFEPEPICLLAEYLGILKNNKMSYGDFVNIIDVNQPFPVLKKINDIPEKNNYFISTNMAARCDYLVMDNSHMPPAGIPTVRMDLIRPAVPPGNCRADLDHLGDETTAESIVNPSIYTNYGLNHRDFFLPRQPKYIKELFESLGYKFPDDTFEKLWKHGVELDQTGLVCVDTFDKLLAATIPPPTFVKDDVEKVC